MLSQDSHIAERQEDAALVVLAVLVEVLASLQSLWTFGAEELLLATVLWTEDLIIAHFVSWCFEV